MNVLECKQQLAQHDGAVLLVECAWPHLLEHGNGHRCDENRDGESREM